MTDVAGKPQPGAIVLLFNKQDRLLQRSATDSLGTFAFGDLLPDLYSVHVSLSSFVPAIKDRIQIKPGMRSLLEVNLSRVFSSVQLVSTTPVSGSLMSDSWKWALRADSSMRPILRFLPAQQPRRLQRIPPRVPRSFHDSRGAGQNFRQRRRHDVRATAKRISGRSSPSRPPSMEATTCRWRAMSAMPPGRPRPRPPSGPPTAANLLTAIKPKFPSRCGRFSFPLRVGQGRSARRTTARCRRCGRWA